MKRQIKHLSPHQNGKVFGVLMAATSFVFLVPMVAIFSIIPTPADHDGPPLIIFLLFPIMYFIMGYGMVAATCAIYNFAFKYLGGIEYEVTEDHL